MRKVAIILLVLAHVLTACEKNEEFTYEKGTEIDSVDISGLTREKAKEKLNSYYAVILSDIFYTIESENQSVRLSAENLGVSFDIDSALVDVEKKEDVKATLTIDEEKANKALENVAANFKEEPKEAYAEYDSCGEFKFFEAKNGSQFDIESLKTALQEAVKSPQSQKLTAQMLKIYPNGSSIEQLKNNNYKIAEFTTFFNKEPYNATGRVKNIVKAANAVNGTVIAPNKSFDTNAILGDRNAKNGWSKAPGIRNGKYELEYGGGVCQVSTTLYNAALLANLQIDERTPHSWPIGYVDIGRDATISTGGPNLIFTNNTDTNITVAAIINEKEQSITVRIYGKKPSEFAKVELSSKQTGTISAPNAEYIRDKDLKEGEYVTYRKSRNGKKAKTFRTFYDENGKAIKTETVSEDTYRAFGAIIKYN